MPSTKTHTYQDQTIAYWDIGSGPVLFMVHGFCEQKSMFTPFLSLADSYRLIIPDLPGFGASDRIEGKGSMNLYAEAIQSLIHALKLSKIHYIGHSMGAYAGLEVLSQMPEYFESFCLFHSHPYADTDAIRDKRMKSIEFLKKHGTAAFFKPFFANLFPEANRANHSTKISALAEEAKAISAEAVIFAQEAMAGRKDHCKTLEEFEGITQYIVGKLDEIAPSDLGLLQSLLGKIGMFHYLKDCGHMGQWEKPDTVLHHFLELQDFFTTLNK